MARLLLLIGILASSLHQQVNAEQDCMYNKCQFPPAGYHVPCNGLGSRQLIRSVNCVDGTLWHICCLSHQRSDIQKSRQEWFRKVTKYAATTGPYCMKRILCEQSCKDGLSGEARSDYPQVLESSDSQDQEFVGAYAEGENLSCYGLAKAGTGDKGNKVVHTGEGCEAHCSGKYAECETDMENNLKAQGIYKVSRASHKLGMFSFSVVWWMSDGIEWTSNHVKTGFNQLLKQMNSLDTQFREHVRDLMKKPKRSIDSDFEKKLEIEWEPFLEIYNQTDQKLVEILAGQVPYSKFTYYRNVTEEIVLSFDFEENFPSSGFAIHVNWSCLSHFAIVVYGFYWT